VRVLVRLPRFRFECRKSGFQTLHSAHSNAISLSFSHFERRSSAGSVSIAPLLGSHREEVKSFSGGVEQLQFIKG
jgi:hypothetical protein